MAGCIPLKTRKTEALLNEIEQIQKQVDVCEFQPGQLFRAIKLPAPIDPEAVKAEYRDGLLCITVAIAAKQQAKKIEVQAA